MPDGATEQASNVDHLPTVVRSPAHDIHIIPGINETLLISTVKFAKAGYVTVFDCNEVNINDQRNTVITVSRAAILCGWRKPGTNDLWCIPLIPVVCNNNVDTVLVKHPPSKDLPKRPPPSEAVHNVYELKMQPELVRYHHAAAGFPTKPTWYKAVKNGQFVSWPGLTAAAVAKHFPKAKETIKGHACITHSSLRSTKQKQADSIDNNDNDNDKIPTMKYRNVFIKVYHVNDNHAIHIMYSNQTGHFPKKSSKGNLYIMVLVYINRGRILVAAVIGAALENFQGKKCF
jgi:hypothetical protein